MNIRISSRIKTPEVTQLKAEYLGQGGDIRKDGTDLLMYLNPIGELELDKNTLEYLLTQGAEISGTTWLSAEVDDAYLDFEVSEFWPNSNSTDEDGNITYKTWREMCLVMKGTEGKSLIRFIDTHVTYTDKKGRIYNSNECGNPQRMTHAGIIRFREQFPDYLTAKDVAEWKVANVSFTLD